MNSSNSSKYKNKDIDQAPKLTLKTIYNTKLNADPYSQTPTSCRSAKETYCKKNQAFNDLSTQYGVSCDFTLFYFPRYIEFCLGRQDMDEKNLKFYRISRQMYQKLLQLVNEHFESENVGEIKEVMSLIKKHQNLILPQDLLQYLGSSEKIPQIFKQILVELNTQQDFYLQDYVSQSYKITDLQILNFIKCVFAREQDSLEYLIEYFPKKASFTYPEFYIAKTIIWQYMTSQKYNPHIINDIIEIIESYRYFIWEKKKKEILEMQNIFAQKLSEKMLIQMKQKEDVRKFGQKLFKFFFIEHDLQKAIQAMEQLTQQVTNEFLQKQLIMCAQSIWKECQFDPILYQDFETKLRKCKYYLKLEERPFDTKMALNLIEESKAITSREAQQIGGDLLNPHFLELIGFIINFLYSSKDCISIYDIFGCIDAHNLSKVVGQQLAHILQLTMKSLQLDKEVIEQCLLNFNSAFREIEKVLILKQID